MSEYSNFIKRSNKKAEDEVHKNKIRFAINNYNIQVKQQKEEQFLNWSEACEKAKEIKSYCLQNLPDMLEKFEKKIKSYGANVLWAADIEEARAHIVDIFKKHKTRKVVKTKSMTTEEIEFNQLCEARDVEVWESDLGEFIVQLANEKPYHIVTPAMHKTREEISELFHEKLNSDKTTSAEELTMVARKHLRSKYLSSDMGVSGANLLIADEGAIVMTENEGNGRLTMSCPPVHVVIAGIEKIIPRLSDLSLFLPLLATSGTGQQITCYNSVVYGPKQNDELDGPQVMYVILLDNGRSELYTKDDFRSILRCIRCGACLNACPVYGLIGGHSYNTTYQGPLGSVITPHFAGLHKWNHLAYASSLCGACTDVCPVKIEIHRLLLENRWLAKRLHHTGKLWTISLKVWSLIMTSRKRLNIISKLARMFMILFLPFLPKSKRKRVPRMPQKSFKEMWDLKYTGTGSKYDQ
jgi:L-lactate dehydrogenase complex protein LldF